MSSLINDSNSIGSRGQAANTPGGTSNNKSSSFLRIKSPNGESIDFTQALSQSHQLYQRQKQASQSSKSNTNAPLNGGDFGSSPTSNPLKIYNQDPAILNSSKQHLQHQMSSNSNDAQAVPDNSHSSISQNNNDNATLQDVPLTVADVEADAQRSTPTTDLTAMASVSAHSLLSREKSSSSAAGNNSSHKTKPSHTNNPLMATNVPPESAESQASPKTITMDAQVRVNRSNVNAKIIDVYQDNLQEEFKRIRKTIKKYRYVAMDTEFPGVVAIPEKKTKYQQIRVNVDLLNIIQLGLCFMNEKGEMDSEASCWQFNFKFNCEVDMYAEDSINLLKQAGIPFKQLEEKGIDRQNFAELFITSGICLNNKVNWITFHAGYDFAYMLKLMRADAQLPESEEKFFELLNLYFPNLYDIKYMVKSCKVQEGGLEAIANELDVDRIGDAHTAGSDAVLTGQTFFKVLKKYFCEHKGSGSKKSDQQSDSGSEKGSMKNEGEDNGRKTPDGNLENVKLGRDKNTEKYRGIIYGIGSGVVTYSGTSFSAGSSRYNNFGGSNSNQNYRGGTMFSSPNRNTSTPPGIAIVKPKKESQALIFTQPPADHDDKSSQNGSFKERDSKEPSKTSTPTLEQQVVPDKGSEEAPDAENVDENNSVNGEHVPVPVSA